MGIQIKFKFFLLFIGILFCLSNNLYAQTNSVDSIQRFTIKNCVNQFDETKIIETNVGYQYWFADKNFLNGQTLKMSVVAPNKATHKPHKHVEDEFFFILEGTAKFYLNGNTVTVGPYTSLYCPSMSMHGISNAGNTVLKYLVIKKYQQE